MAVVLGVNGVFHDPAAALVVDGEIVAAAEEERFSRRKRQAVGHALRPGVADALRAVAVSDGVDGGTHGFDDRFAHSGPGYGRP